MKLADVSDPNGALAWSLERCDEERARLIKAGRIEEADDCLRSRAHFVEALELLKRGPQMATRFAPMTEPKALGVSRAGYVITGYVMTNTAGERAVVELGAVRWLSNEAFQSVMRAPDRVTAA